MKYYSLNRYGCIAALIFLSFVLYAKPNNNTNAFTKSLSFIENKGQITDQYGKHRNDIDYKLDGSNMAMFVGDGQLHYQWYRSNKKEKSRNEKTGLQGDSKSPSGDLGVAVYRMDVVLLGANRNAEVIKEGLQEDYENYYLPQCPDGVTAHRYSKITYKNIYPNIDWEIETAPLPSPEGEASSQGCKYNFIVHPGGDYRDIKIQYNGAASITLKDGALVATTPMGSITENVPYTYDAATHKEIKSNFLLNNNILSYNIALPPGSGKGNAPAFIIDPVLNWATYYGDLGADDGRYLSADTAGNVYLGGQTLSANNIATSGAYQVTFSGTGDAYIVKFNINGQRQWGTYYGGPTGAAFMAISADKNGNVYAGGVTSSTTGISSGPAVHQPAHGSPGGSYGDGFIVKFNAISGGRTWATYYGGSGADDIFSTKCDDSGNVYIAGSTSSSNNIASTAAYQTTPGDGYLAKFSPAGIRLWGTYINAPVADISTRDTIVNICGAAEPSHTGAGIATPGSYQSSYSLTAEPGIVMQFSRSGGRLWGTYYYGGFASSVKFYGVATDAAGNVYVAGNTTATSGVTSPGAYQTTFGGGTQDALLVKLDKSGASRLWATYYGGAANEIYLRLATDERDNVYLCGNTASTSGIATGNGHQPVFGGGNSDGFMAIFKPNGSRTWATYYGGTGLDCHQPFPAPVCYAKGRIYYGGSTTSTNAISTPLSHQPAYGGNADAFVAQFNADTMVYVQQPFTDTAFCAGDTLHLKYGVTFPFRTGNIFTVQLSNSSGSFAAPANIGTATASAAGIINCVIPNVPIGTGYRVRILATAPADTSTDDAFDIHIFAPPTLPVATANTPVCAGQTLNLNSSNSSTGVVWNWIGPNSFTAATQNASIPNVQTNGTGDYIVTANLNGCKRKDTVSVTVNQTPAKPNATSNSPICSGQTLNLFATSTTGGVSWNWVGPGGFNTSAQNPTIPNAQTSNAGSYVVTATLGNCSSSDTEVVVINQGPAVNVYPSPNDTICQGSSVTLVALPISAGTGPAFQWYKNSNPIGGATNTSYSTTPNNGDVYYCQMTPGTGTSCTGAISSNSITMTVLPVTTPSVSISGPVGAQNPYNLLTFHATGTGGGSNPKYQWLRSGQLVQGAIADTWSTQGLYLSQHDTICVILTSSDICAVPKSDTACMVVNILTGVDDVNKNTTIQLYPNPNDGRFTIDAKGISSKEVTIEITNAVGQTVHTQKLNTTKGLLHETISTNNLAAGIYLLKLHDGDAVVTLRLVVRY